MVDLTPPINIHDPTYFINRYAYYRWMRDNQPMCEIKTRQRVKVMLSTLHADVKMLLNDERFVRDPATVADVTGKKPWVPRRIKAVEQHMLKTDGTDHQRLRQLVQHAFTPQSIANWEDTIDRCSHELLDHIEAHATIDLLEAYAVAIPLSIMGKIIGVPTEELTIFHQQANNLNKNVISFQRPTFGSFFKRYLSRLVTYETLHRIIEGRRGDPDDDLLSRLIVAAADDKQLNEEELYAMTSFMLVGGHETTANLIANAIYLLLTHPKQLTQLRQQPNLVETAVEETMRYAPSLTFAMNNYACEDVEFGGTFLPRGTIVLPVLASANRDERVFANPETFDITRTPNPHLAFGYGVHFCLGAALSRLVGKVAIRNLIARFPNLQLAVDPSQIRHIQNPALSALETLPIRLC